MKNIIALFFLCLSAQAMAVNVAGIRLEDNVQLGNSVLQVNGFGVRTSYFVDIYIGTLYLTESNNSASAILADTGAKRMSIYMLRDVNESAFFDAAEKALKENCTSSELAALDARIKEFNEIFRNLENFAKGTVITFDYFPNEGTRFGINGLEIGRVAGAEFNQALLKLWLGNAPVDEKMKKGLLRADHIFSTATAALPTAAIVSSDQKAANVALSITQKIRDLQALKNEGVITNNEFEQKKSKLLESL